MNNLIIPDKWDEQNIMTWIYPPIQDSSDKWRLKWDSRS